MRACNSFVVGSDRYAALGTRSATQLHSVDSKTCRHGAAGFSKFGNADFLCNAACTITKLLQLIGRRSSNKK